jgi:hypothetical protein
MKAIFHEHEGDLSSKTLAVWHPEIAVVESNFSAASPGFPRAPCESSIAFLSHPGLGFAATRLHSTFVFLLPYSRDRRPPYFKT